MTAEELAKSISWLSPIGAASSIAAGDQPEDMKAMNKYIASRVTKTDSAVRLKTEWNAWFHNLSWYELNFDREAWMQARNRVGEFNLANATSSAERDGIERIQRQGSQLELERLAATGKSAPIDTETGKFVLAEPKQKMKLKLVVLGGTLTSLAALGTYVSPIYKVPLALATMVGLLGTGTYVAFKVDV